MGKPTIYENLMGIFQETIKKFNNVISKQITEQFELQSILSTLIILLIWIWAIKKIREGDMFELKNIVSLILFLTYLGFVNWVFMNQTGATDFMNYFDSFINFPSELLNQIIIAGVKATGNSEITSETGIPTMIEQIYNFTFDTAKQTFESFTWWKINVMLLIDILLIIAIVIVEFFFIIVICLIIISSTIQISLWEVMAIFFIPLMFFPQTRAMVGAYIKILISLTLYQPFLLLIGAFYVSILNSTKEMMLDKTLIEGHLVLIIIMGIICIFLIKAAQSIIDGIMGTQSGFLGVSSITNMASKGASALASMAGGAATGSVMGMMKQAFSQGGGGGKGLGLAALSALTGGASAGVAPAAKSIAKGIAKGVSFGASKLGKGGKN